MIISLSDQHCTRENDPVFDRAPGGMVTSSTWLGPILCVEPELPQVAENREAFWAPAAFPRGKAGVKMNQGMNWP